MNIRTVLLYCLILPRLVSAEDSNYRFGRDVLNPDGNQQTLLAVPLDGTVYASTNADFSDLRVRDAAGIETPYLLQKIVGWKSVVKRIPSRGENPVLRKQGEDGIIVTVDLHPDADYIDGLTVVTTQQDFEYVLKVEGSEDGRHWHGLVDNALIYDYSRFMSAANRDVILPVNSDRHFKVIIGKATEARESEWLEIARTLRGGTELQRTEKTQLQRRPLHIERIELWHNQTETVADAEQSFEYPLAFNISQDTEHNTTLIDVQAQNQPLNGFDIKVATPNFSRQAEVSVPRQQGMETRMQILARSNLQGLHFKDINKDDSRIGFAEQRGRAYRISIDNQDNPPLDIDVVTGSGPGYQLVFFAQPGQRYQVQYGSSRAVLPHYDTAPIQTLLSRGYQTITAGLGPENTLAAPPTGFDLIQLINSKLFLGLVIGLMVLVLGWSLFRVSQRL